jgi:hypothetical protein
MSDDCSTQRSGIGGRSNVSIDNLGLSLTRRQQAYLAFLALVLFQGFHELEHVVQVIQQFLLGNPKGAGILGSVFDGPPLHFLYNTGFLALLIATYVLLGMHRSGTRREFGTMVFALLTFAVVWQSWHELEHIVKLYQYYTLGYINNVGGILAIGPGAILPLFNNVWLHFWYNTIAYVPIVIAYFASGMHRRLAIDLGEVRHQAA